MDKVGIGPVHDIGGRHTHICADSSSPTSPGPLVGLRYVLWCW